MWHALAIRMWAEGTRVRSRQEPSQRVLCYILSSPTSYLAALELVRGSLGESGKQIPPASLQWPRVVWTVGSVSRSDWHMGTCRCWKLGTRHTCSRAAGFYEEFWVRETPNEVSILIPFTSGKNNAPQTIYTFFQEHIHMKGCASNILGLLLMLGMEVQPRGRVNQGNTWPFPCTGQWGPGRDLGW